MKIRNIHPCGDVAVLIPGDQPKQFTVKAGEVFTVTKAEGAVLLLSPGNFEPVDNNNESE